LVRDESAWQARQSSFFSFCAAWDVEAQRSRDKARIWHRILLAEFTPSRRALYEKARCDSSHNGQEANKALLSLNGM
jgi:hypothetical protein